MDRIFFTIIALFLTISPSIAQGPLAPPPGAPQPNMKSLEEIWDIADEIKTDLNDLSDDTRSPISIAETTISESGSYYLTRNLRNIRGNASAITITAANVTLDLNGFTIWHSTAFGSASTRPAISLSNQAHNVRILNGKITSFATAVSGTSAIGTNVTDISCYKVKAGFSLGRGSHFENCQILESSISGNFFGFSASDNSSALNCKVSKVTASGSFTGFSFNNRAHINNCQVVQNSGSSVSGINAKASSHIANCLVSGNSASGSSTPKNYSVTGGSIVTASVGSDQPDAEGRIPISSLPFTINGSGSYYLTDNLYFIKQTGHAITINGGDVTIDFAGFTLTSTPLVTGDAIHHKGRGELTVRNGKIAGTSTVSYKRETALGIPYLDWTVNSSGFGRGIQHLGNGGAVRISDLTIQGCRSTGVVGTPLIAADCIASENGGDGFEGGHDSIITRSIANKNGGNGFYLERASISYCTGNYNQEGGFNLISSVISHSTSVASLIAISGGTQSFCYESTLFDNAQVTETGNSPQ